MSESGWYPDPIGAHENRWWDGEAWTTRVSSGGVIADDASGGTFTPYTSEDPDPEPSEPAEGPGKQPRRLGVGAVLGIGVAALLVGLLAGFAVGNSDAEDLKAEAAAANARAHRFEQQVNDRAAKAEAAKAEADRIAAKQAADAAAAQKEQEAAAAAEKKKADDAAADQQRQQQAAAEAAAAAAAKRRTVGPGDGIFAVGADIDPGRWRTTGGPSSCYYAILTTPDTSNVDSIVNNNNVDGPAIVDLAQGQFFEISHCGEWRHE